MMLATAQNTTRDALLERVSAVMATFAPRVAEIDEAGRIPPDLFDALEATGVFQALTPKQYGGLELRLDDASQLIMAGARVSGSIGWVMMIHVQQSLLSGVFRKDAVLKLFKEHPRARVRGVAAPKGVATPVEGGYIVSGQWPFASGGPNPHMIGANCIVMENGAPRIGANGMPELILVWVPAEQVTFLDTWHVVGMRGTNSCDFAMREVFVPANMAIDLFNAQNFFETPAARLPLRVALSPGHCAVALGIAQGALDEISALAKTKRAAMNPQARLADDPYFRHALGESTLRLAASQAMLEKWTHELEAVAAAGEALTPYQIMMGRTMTGFITSECTQIVNVAFSLAGSASVYNSCPLERRLRDIHVAGQHISTFKELYRLLGATVIDEELTPFELYY
jgi:alkylation response protein AidB-like acyl-CoA dehydrogenase